MVDRQRQIEETRASWNVATRAHNAHKRDQAGFLRGGGSTLYPEERALLGRAVGRDDAPGFLRGVRLLHLCCNAGQDTLSLAALGADVVGVDLSDEAIRFARALSADSGIGATFVEAEARAFVDGALERAPFDVVFCSYGALGWIDDVRGLLRGAARRLLPGGALVVVEFHPLVWSFGDGFALKDPYFAPGRAFSEPVSDYVGEVGGLLSPSGHVDAPPIDNPHVAHSFQHTVADLVTATADAGLVVEELQEWPYANGCKVIPALVPEGRRFVMPPGLPSLPLMMGLVARAR